MASLDSQLARLLATLPDLPRWAELRSVLIAGSALVLGSPEACVVVAGGEDVAPVIFVVGLPQCDLLAQASERAPGADVLLVPESRAHLEGLARIAATRIVVHTRSSHEPIASLRTARIVERLTPGDLRDLPDDLRAELVSANQTVPISVAYAAERPVAFSYAGAITETLWDVSIDTVPDLRRSGYATAAVAALVAYMGERGRAPMWCAAEDNPASMRLARKLGFRGVDELFLLPASAFSAGSGN